MALTHKTMHKKPEYKIVTSWDDGYGLDLRIADLLTKYKLSGVFYIVLDWIDNPDYLTWDDIKKLKERGFSIGSHTMSHPSDLKKLFDEELHYEIQNSKDLLESALGGHTESFCYPCGRADERIKDFVANAGYINARGTGRTGVTDDSDRLYLPGTIHIFQREEYGNKSIVDYAKEVIDKVEKEGGYCNIWGHSQEIDKNGLWNVLEEVLKYARG